MISSYSTSGPLTASPAASGGGTTITAPAGCRGWFVSVATQAAYVTFDGSAPTATNGLTVPAGSVVYWPVGKNLTVLSASAGSVVNAIPLT